MKKHIWRVQLQGDLIVKTKLKIRMIKSIKKSKKVSWNLITTLQKKGDQLIGGGNENPVDHIELILFSSVKTSNEKFS